MFLTGFFVGGVVYFLISSVMIAGKIEDTWDSGFDSGIRASNTEGHVIARNDPIDEIMVEYENVVARYKKVD